MYYSPVRRCIGSKLPQPLDLHVLGLPPAFNLSHDQTLQFKIICHPEGQLKLGSTFCFSITLANCRVTYVDKFGFHQPSPQVPTRIA